MTEHKTPQTIKNLSPAQIRLTTPNLSNMGMGEIAYVRAVGTNGTDVYGIFAANGEPLATMNDRGSAMAAAIQNDLVPLSVH
ncbi:MAG: hypothetical protein CBD27_07645 [Rhodospirillaceae bacterium TMED167]|nr:hypothetical protein [Rhodospirillaceae bacterium]OUW26675.1 MAG: hypothetical protein CBD27_07645 [Rhodospirillaceae bacterium TMED167]